MYLDWEEIIFKTVLGCLGVALIMLFIAIPFVAVNSNKAKESFMAECLEDGKKQYECTAMWRAGESNTAARPMPVIIR